MFLQQHPEFTALALFSFTMSYSTSKLKVCDYEKVIILATYGET